MSADYCVAQGSPARSSSVARRATKQYDCSSRPAIPNANDTNLLGARKNANCSVSFRFVATACGSDSYLFICTYLLANTPNDCCAKTTIVDFSDRSIVPVNEWFDCRPRPIQSTVPYGPALRAMTPADCWTPAVLVWAESIFHVEARTVDYSWKQREQWQWEKLALALWPLCEWV